MQKKFLKQYFNSGKMFKNNQLVRTFAKLQKDKTESRLVEQMAPSWSIISVNKAFNDITF